MGERLIRPCIRSSDRTAALIRSGGWMAQVFYDWLLTVVDDFGRYDARPSILRPVVFPLLLELVRESDVSRCLAECEKAGLIRLYSVEGKPFLEVQNFKQRLRASKSRWPEPSNGTSGICHDIVMTMSTDTDTEAHTEAHTGAAVAADDFPPWMKDPAFVQAWSDFEVHRTEIKHPVKPTSKSRLLKKLAKWGFDKAVTALENSVENGWQGVFPPEEKRTSGRNGVHGSSAKLLHGNL